MAKGVGTLIVIKGSEVICKVPANRKIAEIIAAVSHKSMHIKAKCSNSER